ncbi:hypothetical protein GF386_01780 [Candidatus Pacearchaeota archaeon]|nr:hypothetical protein [Candidatus Pacearchaeota archaeon]MBD3282910.1 hypothetical protein [Candidatus Pacearchaeota archaeon]
MKTGFILMIVIFLFITGVVFSLNYLKSASEKKSDTESDSCKKLGCPLGTKYVGSKNSDKYYSCDCHYADQIKPENIICFSSDAAAVEMGYVRVDC